MAVIRIFQKMKIGQFQLSPIQCKSTVIPKFFNIFFCIHFLLYISKAARKKYVEIIMLELFVYGVFFAFCPCQVS